MIETKEQYEELQLMRLIPKHGPPVGKATHKPLFETIEALRRFVRASDAVEDGTVSFDLHHEQVEELRASRKALPKWIADG